MATIYADIRDSLHRVTCTGGTISVYDLQGTLLAKFRDLTHLGKVLLSPDGNWLAAKSCEGKMAMYDLRSLTLVKKFRIGKNASQDENFCFSPDSQYLLNLELIGQTLHSVLAVYRTEDCTLVHRWFDDRKLTCLTAIEYDADTERYYLTGYDRDPETRVAATRFAARLGEGTLEDVRVIPEHVCDFYNRVSDVRMNGYFTAESSVFDSCIDTWQSLLTRPVFEQLITQLREPHSLAELWRSYDPQLKTPGVPGLDLPTPEQLRASMQQHVLEQRPQDDAIRLLSEKISRGTHEG